MKGPAIQLFTLREVDESLADLLGRVGEAGYAGVEFAGLGGASPAEVATALDRAEVEAVGAHVAAADVEDDYEAVLETYRALDCDRLVVPSYAREAFESADGAREAGERLAALADRLADDGASLHYHNHTFEFTPVGGRTAFDVFLEHADGVGVEIDTGLATHAGADPLALLERYGDRVELLHLTDTRSASRTTVHVELGAGEVDLRAAVEGAAGAGAEWVVYEHGRTTDPLESLAHGHSVVTGLLAEAVAVDGPRVESD